MFSCICPFVSEELWESLGHKSLIDYEPWPTYDENKLQKNSVNIAVSINGKLRDTLVAPIDSGDEELTKLSLALDSVKRHLEGKSVKKVIVVKNKIVNIVAN